MNLNYAGCTYVLEEVEAKIISSDADAFWLGQVTYISRTPIENTRDFTDLMHAAVKDGLDGAMCGELTQSAKLPAMTGLDIKRVFTDEEKRLYGEIKAVVTVRYKTIKGSYVPILVRKLEAIGVTEYAPF